MAGWSLEETSSVRGWLKDGTEYQQLWKREAKNAVFRSEYRKLRAPSMQPAAVRADRWEGRDKSCAIPDLTFPERPYLGHRGLHTGKNNGPVREQRWERENPGPDGPWEALPGPWGTIPQGADRLPPSSTRGKAGRNHLNEEITPLPPTGIGERLLRRCELPL